MGRAPGRTNEQIDLKTGKPVEGHLGKGGTGSSQRPWVDDSGPPASVPTQKTVLTPRDITVTQSASGLPIDIPLGRCLQPQTKLIYAEAFNSSLLVWIADLGHGPVESIQPLADGKPMRLVSGSFTQPNGTHFIDASGFMSVYVYDGTQTSLASSGLASWDAAAAVEEVHTGLALAVIFQQYDADNFNAVASPTFIIEGYRLCKDPTDNIQKYTTSPAIHARELLRNSVWGLQMPDDAQHFDDSTNLGGWARAVADCALSIFPPPPSSPPTVSVSGAGGIIAGTYWFTFTSVVGTSETLESPLSSMVTITTPSQVTVTVPAGGAGTESRRVYRSIASGLAAPRYFVGSIANNTAGATLVVSAANTTVLATGVAAPTIAPRPERYIHGNLISRQATGQNWLDTILAHFAGKISKDNGRYQCRVDQPLDVGYVPMVIRDEDVIVDGVVTQKNVDPLSVEVWRKNDPDLFNIVTGNYLDANNNFEPASVTLMRDAVRDLTERPVPTTYEIPGSPDKNQTTRLLTQYLNRAWDDLCWRVRGNRSLLALQPGIDVTHCLIADLDFYGRILSVEIDGDVILVEGDEYNASSYSDTIQNEDSIVTSTSPDPSATPPNPEDCDVREVLAEAGVSPGYLVATFTPADTPWYRATRVVVNDGLNTYIAGEQKIGPIRIPNPRRGAAHVVSFYTITSRGTTISSGVTLPPFTPILYVAAVPDIVDLAAPFDTEDHRGTITGALPAYDGLSKVFVYDNFGSPASPPLIQEFSTSIVAAGQPLNVKTAIHGDGFATDMVFSVIVKLGNAVDSKSPGVPISWTIAASGQTFFTVGYDPRDVTFDNSKLWVSNFNGAQVQRLDRVTGLVDLNVAVGSKPYGILYAGGQIWVANFGSDSLTRMNTDGSGSATVALTAGDGPLGLETFTTSGGTPYLAVSCHKSGVVRFVNLSTHAATSSVSVGAKPCFMKAVSVSGQARLYVANYQDNTVSVIGDSLSVIATVHVGQGPFGMTSDGARIWVCNYADSTLSLITIATNTLYGSVELGAHVGPTDAEYVNGYVWVTEAQAREVTRVSTAFLLPTAHNPTLSSPRSIMYDGTRLRFPLNLNEVSSTIPVVVTNPSPGGGASPSFSFIIIGVDPSPLPS